MYNWFKSYGDFAEWVDFAFFDQSNMSKDKKEYLNEASRLKNNHKRVLIENYFISLNAPIALIALIVLIVWIALISLISLGALVALIALIALLA